MYPDDVAKLRADGIADSDGRRHRVPSRNNNNGRSGYSLTNACQKKDVGIVIRLVGIGRVVMKQASSTPDTGAYDEGPRRSAVQLAADRAWQTVNQREPEAGTVFIADTALLASAALSVEQAMGSDKNLRLLRASISEMRARVMRCRIARAEEYGEARNRMVPRRRRCAPAGLALDFPQQNLDASADRIQIGKCCALRSMSGAPLVGD